MKIEDAKKFSRLNTLESKQFFMCYHFINRMHLPAKQKARSKEWEVHMLVGCYEAVDYPLEDRLSVAGGYGVGQILRGEKDED